MNVLSAGGDDSDTFFEAVEINLPIIQNARVFVYRRHAERY